MQNSFFRSLTTKDLRTENGMPTHSSSGSYLVDFFYKMGGVRKSSEPLSTLVQNFYAAFAENPRMAVRALFYLRDPRGGMQERNAPRVLWHFFAESHPELVGQLLRYIPEHGRWDDILAFIGTPVEKIAVEFILEALSNGDELCAKWMPREGKSLDAFAKFLMKSFHIKPRDYRRMLSRFSSTLVERQMCQQEWSKIKFEHVPSQAMKVYREAFKRHQPERFAEYIEAVTKGEKKINTATLSPVDIVHQYLAHGMTMDKTLEALWANLKDVVPENVSFLPILDFSGSMDGTPMEVAASLGIYLSRRNKSIFQNGVLTFSRSPKFYYLNGKTLLENLRIIWTQREVANTNLSAVFDLILTSAVQAGLSPKDMPTNLMIISDMQFDECTGNPNSTSLEMISRKYRAAGYTRPNIFFWNVRTSSGVPAKIDDRGVGLVSGFSPNLLKTVLSGDLNPISQVLATLSDPRYNFVEEIVK